MTGGGSAVPAVRAIPKVGRPPKLPEPAMASVAPAGGAGYAEAGRRGRMTKEERKKAMREEAEEEIKVFVETNPSRREVRNFMFRRMAKYRSSA